MLSNTYVRPLSRINIFLLLSTCTDEVLSAPNIITAFANQLFYNEKAPRTSNEIPHTEYKFVSVSSFLVNLTSPDK